MKNKTRRLAAFLLSAAVVITAVPGMQERVYAQKTGGYTESPKSENVPVVQETKSRLKKAEAVPSAYMNKLSELTIRYPGVRDQGKYDTCWAFSAIGLAEFDLIADNQTADKSIDLSELQLAYFTYNNVEDPLGGTFGDSLNIMKFGFREPDASAVGRGDGREPCTVRSGTDHHDTGKKLRF